MGLLVLLERDVNNDGIKYRNVDFVPFAVWYRELVLLGIIFMRVLAERDQPLEPKPVKVIDVDQRQFLDASGRE